MLMMDPDYNLLVLVPAIKEYIDDLEEKKIPVEHVDTISKKDVEDYESVVDFVYKKMSVGGIIDRGAVLSDKDLRIIKRLASDDLKKHSRKK